MISKNSPIFVIGAGRSGTNLMADTLCQIPKLEYLAELRYVWSYKTKLRKVDARDETEAIPEVKEFITSYIEDRVSRANSVTFIDKTPSNALRIPFIREIYPEAKFIHVIRDVRDNIRSKRVQFYGGHGSYIRGAGLEHRTSRSGLVRNTSNHIYRLFAEGALPYREIPNFVTDNLVSGVAHLATGKPRMWGERVPGYREVREAFGENAAFAYQWREVISQAAIHGRRLEEGRYVEIRFEDLVSQSESLWDRLSSILDEVDLEPCRQYLRQHAEANRAASWSDEMSARELEELEPWARPTLEFLGYSWERRIVRGTQLGASKD